MNNAKTPNTQVFNVLLNILCAGLLGIGLWQVLTNRLEDGIINFVIALSLSTIPFSNGQFNYSTAPLWQKIYIISISTIVICATVAVLYLIFKK